MSRNLTDSIPPHSQVKVLWLQVLGLAGIQGAITLCWVIYKLYLPKLLVQFGFPVGLGLTLLIIENLLAAVMEPLMGGLSDKTRHWMGTRFPFISVGVVLSSALFILIPAIVIFGKPTVVFRTILLIVIICWALAMAVFRSPVMSLLGRYSTPTTLPLAASLLTLTGGLIGSLQPLTSKIFLGWGPAITFAIGSFVLLLATTILRFINPPEIVGDERMGDIEENLIPQSGRSIWRVKSWLNNKSYPPNASPLQRIVPTPHSLLPNLGLLFLTGAMVTWGASFFMPTIQKCLTNQLGAAKVPSVMFIIGISLACAALPGGAIATKLGNSKAMLFGIGVIIPLILMISSTKGVTTTIIIVIAIASFSLIMNGAIPFALSMIPPERAGLGIGMYFGGVTAGAGLFGLVFPHLNSLTPITTAILSAIAFLVAGCAIALSQKLPSTTNN
ncbi:MFS transporter [Limnofasciculus baicalensis]|uniref:MFS transporter n=1 Tax=Limnofasciculus baicalensis BBK-W-15 TaxID=2699891 RepID=A0AAE3GPM4_9CYAN|nr:MFS transporter [Limnofasciculus baicalensis]MCP2728426.1 MFS transporter [Limnofasciculus baicalensis BBK-W-15]